MPRRMAGLVFGKPTRPCTGGGWPGHQVAAQAVEHYHEERPHQGLQQRVPRPREAMEVGTAAGPVLRHDRLGGVLHEYFRQAA
jgi:hypothetical protein